MSEKKSIIGNEDGSAIIFALLILAILTILGISSTSTTEVELKIVGNERQYQRDFYIADSVWQLGGYWLEGEAVAPSPINTDAGFTADQLQIVRNFGNAAADDLNDSFTDGTEDGNISAIPYWYNIQYDDNETVAGSGAEFRKFNYIVNANANKKQQIEARVSKIYKIGY